MYSSSILPETPSRSLDIDTVTNGILKAFRELQIKAKVLEKDRDIAIQERNEIKYQLSQSQRDYQLWRHAFDVEITEKVDASNHAIDKLKNYCANLQLRLIEHEDIEKRTKSSIETNSVLFSRLQEETTSLDLKCSTLSNHKKFLKKDLHSIRERCQSIEFETRCLAENQDHLSTNHQLEKSIRDLQIHLERTRKGHSKSELQTFALERYVDLILSINADLCELLVVHEETKYDILKLADRYAPPHYSWPKNVRAQGFLQLLEVASDVATEAAIQRSTERTKKMIQSTLSSLSSIGKGIEGQKGFPEDPPTADQDLSTKEMQVNEVLRRHKDTLHSVSSSLYKSSTSPSSPTPLASPSNDSQDADEREVSNSSSDPEEEEQWRSRFTRPYPIGRPSPYLSSEPQTTSRPRPVSPTPTSTHARPSLHPFSHSRVGSSDLTRSLQDSLSVFSGQLTPSTRERMRARERREKQRERNSLDRPRSAERSRPISPSLFSQIPSSALDVLLGRMKTDSETSDPTPSPRSQPTPAFLPSSTSSRSARHSLPHQSKEFNRRARENQNVRQKKTHQAKQHSKEKSHYLPFP